MCHESEIRTGPPPLVVKYKNNNFDSFSLLKTSFPKTMDPTLGLVYELTSIQMYRLALLLLGQQIKQFKKGSHMFLGYLGPDETRSTQLEIVNQQNQMRDFLEEFNEQHFVDGKFFGGENKYGADEGSQMKALFYFENSLHAAQVSRDVCQRESTRHVLPALKLHI